MFGGEYARAPRMSAGKLDGRFHALASRRTEESLRQAAPRALTQLLGKFPGNVCNVGLNHRRTAALQFTLQSAHDLRMVMANIVDTVSGEKVEDPLSVVGEKLCSQAPFIADVHLQQVEKPHPFRVYTPGVTLRLAFRLFDLEGCMHSAHNQNLRLCHDRSRRIGDSVRGDRRKSSAAGVDTERLNYGALLVADKQILPGGIDRN